MARRVARSADIWMSCATGICPPAPVSWAHSILAPWGSPVSGSKPASTAGRQPTFIRSCDACAVSRNAPNPTIRPTRQARTSCWIENHRRSDTCSPSRYVGVHRRRRIEAAQAAARPRRTLRELVVDARPGSAVAATAPDRPTSNSTAHGSSQPGVAAPRWGDRATAPPLRRTMWWCHRRAARHPAARRPGSPARSGDLRPLQAAAM